MNMSTPNRAMFPRSLTGDPRQVASVRRVTLDDGVERGNRALVFSTGGGLDFWILSDRSLDIGPLWFRGMPVAWQHPSGYMAPALHQRHGDEQTGLERALSGFLVTCGAEHTRQPADGNVLHGNLPLTPARVTQYGENWQHDSPILFCEGEVTIAHLAKSSYRLIRRIEAPIGGTSLKIKDTFENIGLEAFELSLLYHFNFGFPALGDATTIDVNGENWLRRSLPTTSGPALEPTFDCRRVEEHGDINVIVRRPQSEHWPGFQARFETSAQQLPFMQIWSDPRPNRNIIAVEPANSERRADGTSGTGATLETGGTWTNQIEIEFSDPA